MGWLLSRLRFVFTVIRGGEVGIQPPRNLRAVFGAETAGAFPLEVDWDVPASWGNDADGTGTRSFNGSYRRLATNADGTTYTGPQTNSVVFTTNETDTDHTLPNAAVGSLWEFRLRATNKDGDHSNYVTLTIHAVVQNGFLLLDHRYLRVRATATSYRRLRLTP